MAVAAGRLGDTCREKYGERVGRPPCRRSSPTCWPTSGGLPGHHRRLPRHAADADGFAAERARDPARQLDFDDVDAPQITRFLDHLDTTWQQHPYPQRPAAAIHSLFAYAPLRHPEHGADIERVLAIPPKRADQAIITFLTEARKPRALLAAPDRATRTGRRDHALDHPRHPDRAAGRRAHRLDPRRRPPRCRRLTSPATARARKDRITPLTPGTAATLRTWLAERAGDARRPAVRHHPRRADEPRRPANSGSPSTPPRAGRYLPLAGQQEHHPPRAASHSGHAPAARRGTTSPSSRYGWATNRSPPPRSTFKPTWPSSSGRLTGPRHSPAPRAATNPPTSSLPSSRPCNYADTASPGTPARQRLRPGIGITTVSA